MPNCLCVLVLCMPLLAACVAVDRNHPGHLREELLQLDPSTPAASDLLKKAIGDTEPRIRALAVDRIGNLKMTGLASIVSDRMVSDESPLVRIYATRAVVSLAEAKSLGLLASVVDRSPPEEEKVRSFALRELCALDRARESKPIVSASSFTELLNTCDSTSYKDARAAAVGEAAEERRRAVEANALRDRQAWEAKLQRATATALEMPVSAFARPGALLRSTPDDSGEEQTTNPGDLFLVVARARKWSAVCLQAKCPPADVRWVQSEQLATSSEVVSAAQAMLVKAQKTKDVGDLIELVSRLGQNLEEVERVKLESIRKKAEAIQEEALAEADASRRRLEAKESRERNAWGKAHYRYAIQAAKSAIYYQLRSPSTASWISSQVLANVGALYTVHVVVDAMNGFGGLIRTAYCVTVRLNKKSRDNYYINQFTGIIECDRDPKDASIDAFRQALEEATQD